jgi:hypothetical protein
LGSAPPLESPQGSLNKFRAKFNSSELERAFRDAVRDNDRIVLSVMLGLSTVVPLVFSYSDFTLHGFGKTFWSLAAMRCGFAAYSLVVLAAMWRTKRANSADWALLLLTLSATVVSFSVGTTRPPTYLLFVTVDMAALMSFYFLLPNRWLFQVLPAVTYTLSTSTIVLFYKVDVSSIEFVVIFVSLLLVNVTGAYVSWNFHINRRSRFHALLMEREARSALEDATSKLDTLEGLLAICANCKKIKNDDGSWQSVETYITNRTEAKFTHAVCPDCSQELYPEIKS